MQKFSIIIMEQQKKNVDEAIKKMTSYLILTGRALNNYQILQI